MVGPRRDGRNGLGPVQLSALRTDASALQTGGACTMRPLWLSHRRLASLHGVRRGGHDELMIEHHDAWHAAEPTQSSTARAAGQKPAG